MLEQDEQLPGITGLELLGRGTTSTAYRAMSTTLGRTVAVKVLGRTLSGEDAVAAFRRDADLQRELAGHPHAVAVHESGVTEQGHPFLVVEHLPRSLADVVAEHGPMALPQVLALGVQVASALEAAHKRGILHRDIKPADIRLAPGNVPRLGDFGLVRYAGVPDPTLMTPSRRLAHASPELVEAKPLDERSDIYALASTLHEAITSWPPFERSGATSAAEITARIIGEPPPSLAPYGVHPAVEAALAAAMAKDPSRRPATAEVFAASLLAAARTAGIELPDEIETPTTARAALPVIGGLEPVGTVTVAGGGVARPAPTRPPLNPLPNLNAPLPPPRSKWPVVFGVLAVAAVVAGGIAWAAATQGDDQGSVPATVTTLAVTTVPVTTAPATTTPVSEAAYTVSFDSSTGSASISGRAPTADADLLNAVLNGVAAVQATLTTVPGGSPGTIAIDAATLLDAMLHDLVRGSLSFDGTTFRITGTYADAAALADLQSVIAGLRTPVDRPNLTAAVGTGTTAPATTGGTTTAPGTTGAPATSMPSGPHDFGLTVSTPSFTVKADGKNHLVPLTFTATGAQATTFCFVQRQVTGPAPSTLTMTYSSCDASRFVTVRLSTPGVYTVVDTFSDGPTTSGRRSTVTFTITGT